MPMKANKFGIKVLVLTDDKKLPPLVVPNRTSELIKQKGLGYYIVWTLSEPYLDNC